MKHYLFILILLFSLTLVSADCILLKQNEIVNYRFRCIDVNNSYCSNSTILKLNSEYPNGSNALDNKQLTANPTYFNITLPTDALGIYNDILVSNTTNGTITEFCHEVTFTGYKLDTSKSIVLFIGLGIMLLIGIMLFTFGIYTKGIIKVFSLGLSILIIVFSVGYTINILNIGLGEYSTLLGSFNGLYILLIGLLSAGGIGILLFLVYAAFEYFNKQRGFKD